MSKLFVLRIVAWSFNCLLRIIISYLQAYISVQIICIKNTGWNDKIVVLEKTTWFHLRFMITGFPFFVADHLLVGHLCTNSKSDRSLLSRLKVTQCWTCEIGDGPLSCSLPIQVMTTGSLPVPSKCKSGRFNAWEHSSMHRTTLGRWWSGRTPPGRLWSRSSSKRSRQSLMKLPSGLFGRLPDLGVTRTTVNACVKEDLKCRSYRRQTSQILTEKTKNLRLIKSVRPPPPPTWTRWTTSFGHTSRTSPTWPPTRPKSALSPPSTEYSPSSHRRLWKRHAPSSGFVSRQWFRLKAATLNRCQLPELIFSITVLK